MGNVRSKAAVLVGLCEFFSKELGEAGFDLYLSAIDDLSDDEFARAATTAIREREFFPVPAAILKLAGKGAPSREDAAIRAWSEAWDAACEKSAYISVQFANRTTMRVISTMGGWAAFCHPEQDIQWHRKTFVDTYGALAGDPGPSPLRLLGVHERKGGKFETVTIGVIPQADRLLPTSDAAVADEYEVGLDAATALAAMNEIKRRVADTPKVECCPSFDSAECAQLRGVDCDCACHQCAHSEAK